MLSVRVLQLSDSDHLINYWLKSSDAHLLKMGVDLNKLPTKEELHNMFTSIVSLPLLEKPSYAIIWLLDNVPIGHCNVNQIQYKNQAFMHLHIWKNEKRQKGLGVKLIKLSLPFFFNDLKLKKIYCEPYALNPAPNKTLEKIGFTLEKEYTTTPGSLNFEQPVKRWVLTKEVFLALN